MSENINKIDMTGVTEVPAGAVENSKITAIAKGTQGEFRSDEYYAASTLSKSEVVEAKASAAVEITTANGASLVLNLPKTVNGVTNLHPKSTLAVYKKKYGKTPEVGDTVATQLDSNGFWRIIVQ